MGILSLIQQSLRFFQLRMAVFERPFFVFNFALYHMKLFAKLLENIDFCQGDEL